MGAGQGVWLRHSGMWGVGGKTRPTVSVGGAGGGGGGGGGVGGGGGGGGEEEEEEEGFNCFTPTQHVM